MTYSQLWRPNLAGLYYTLALGVAYKRHQWIWDPDYASVQDHEAWIKIRRDANTAAAIHKRRASVAALDWSVQAASDDPADELCARLQEGMLGSIRQPWMARYLQTEAIFRGSAYQFVEGEWRWQKMKGDVRVRRWWIPTRLRHVDRWRFRLEPLADRPGNSAATQWELFHVGAQEWHPLRHAQWFVCSTYEDSEDTLGYGRGLLQAIFFYWRAKEVAFTQGLSGLERWSQGILHYAMEGKRPGSVGRDNDTVRDAAIDELKKHRSEHILVHDKEDDLEVLTGGMEGHQICSWFMEYLDRGIDRVCMQGSLPTGGGPSDSGSYGRAETEAGEGQATYQADRRMLAEDYDHSLMDLGWRLNLGNLIDACRDRGLTLGTRGKIHLADETREDPREVAQGVQTLIAVPGMKLIKREVYERTGWTMPRGDEETIGGEAPGAQGAPGMAGPVAGAGAPAAGGEAMEGGGDLPDIDLEESLQGLLSETPEGSAVDLGEPPEDLDSFIDEAENAPEESMAASVDWRSAYLYARPKRVGPHPAAGQPCKRGQTAKSTGCIPKAKAQASKSKRARAFRNALDAFRARVSASGGEASPPERRSEGQKRADVTKERHRKAKAAGFTQAATPEEMEAEEAERSLWQSKRAGSSDVPRLEKAAEFKRKRADAIHESMGLREWNSPELMEAQRAEANAKAAKRQGWSASEVRRYENIARGKRDVAEQKATKRT